VDDCPNDFSYSFIDQEPIDIEKESSLTLKDITFQDDDSKYSIRISHFKEPSYDLIEFRYLSGEKIGFLENVPKKVKCGEVLTKLKDEYFDQSQNIAILFNGIPVSKTKLETFDLEKCIKVDEVRNSKYIEVKKS